MIITEQEQEDVIAFLRAALTFDGIAPEEIVTHVSHIFLTKERAYKLKRAVVFPFLDFRSVAARCQACRDEISINRRTAPTVYLRVCDVVRTSSGLKLCPDDLECNGDGGIVDCLVEMARFDDNTLFDHLAEQENGLRRRMMEDLAVGIANFHAEAEVLPEAGGYAGIRRIAENNRQSFARLPAGTFPTQDADAICQQTLATIDAAQLVLNQRQAAGRVRACHGDLHLRNICLVDGRPTLFDAIEFSKDFSDIDVMYDLAFLLMDLIARDHRRLACMVLNRYLDEGREDANVFSVLPIFLSMRAQIRAHVGAAIANSQETPESRARELEKARNYLAQSIEDLKPRPVRLIAVGGLSGSGKSRLARELAPHLDGICGARVIRSDAVRKNIAGVPLDQSLGPDGYSADMTTRTYATVMDQASQVIENGQTVILDAVFAKPEQRATVANLAADLGVPFDGIWVDASDAVRIERVRTRTRNVSDATTDVAKSQSSYETGEINWSLVDSSGEKSATIEAGLRIIGR